MSMVLLLTNEWEIILVKLISCIPFGVPYAGLDLIASKLRIESPPHVIVAFQQWERDHDVCVMSLTVVHTNNIPNIHGMAVGQCKKGI